MQKTSSRRDILKAGFGLTALLTLPTIITSTACSGGDEGAPPSFSRPQKKEDYTKKTTQSCLEEFPDLENATEGVKRLVGHAFSPEEMGDLKPDFLIYHDSERGDTEKRIYSDSGKNAWKKYVLSIPPNERAEIEGLRRNFKQIYGIKTKTQETFEGQPINREATVSYIDPTSGNGFTQRALVRCFEMDSELSAERAVKRKIEHLTSAYKFSIFLVTEGNRIVVLEERNHPKEKFLWSVQKYLQRNPQAKFHSYFTREELAEKMQAMQLSPPKNFDWKEEQKRIEKEWEKAYGNKIGL